jgi:hypothetical protein
VYIREPNSFPPSIVGVETAVPCFIGYTERAQDRDGRHLDLVPKRVESMAEFVQFFGSGYPEQYYLVKGEAPGAADPANASGDGDNDDATPAGRGDQDWGVITLDGKNFYHLFEAGQASFYLYNSMRLFYANGGGSCYVISCGTYGGGTAPAISPTPIESALKVCRSFVGPTMVAIPDAVLLGEDEYNRVVAAMLAACAEAGDRMALIDVWRGNNPLAWPDQIGKFRDAIRRQTQPEMLKFGAAYFPPLVTSIVATDEIDLSNFSTDADKVATLKSALGTILLDSFPAPTMPGSAANDGGEGDAAAPGQASKVRRPGGSTRIDDDTAGTLTVTADRLNPKGARILTTYVDQIGVENGPLSTRQLTEGLMETVPGFKQLLSAIAATQGVLPPSGAMAGVWTANDIARGVWNAPANTGIATMIRPLLPVNDSDQQDLNVPVQGLAVNAIRTFQGRGSLVWGARTLDSLSNDWRYVQVRRTMIYVEQSVKQALEAMVFRPNTPQTWVTVTSMIESFLHGLWSAGGLMGGSPGEAYSVLAGLGSTMTPDDVLNGVMRVQITLQMVHPAEFIELTFKQQLLGGA